MKNKIIRKILSYAKDSLQT